MALVTIAGTDIAGALPESETVAKLQAFAHQRSMSLAARKYPMQTPSA
jgi:hypothetical protein